MLWQIIFFDAFEAEFHKLGPNIQDELLACASLLERFGPELGRPRVDTLKGSKHKNMKELRFDADGGVWRVAFAFDPKRCAILLCAATKHGRSQARVYKTLISLADTRFDAHLDNLKRSDRHEGTQRNSRKPPSRPARKNPRPHGGARS